MINSLKLCSNFAAIVKQQRKQAEDHASEATIALNAVKSHQIASVARQQRANDALKVAKISAGVEAPKYCRFPSFEMHMPDPAVLCRTRSGQEPPEPMWMVDTPPNEAGLMKTIMAGFLSGAGSAAGTAINMVTGAVAGAAAGAAAGDAAASTKKMKTKSIDDKIHEV